MKFKWYAVCLALSMSIPVWSQDINPMTQALIEGYNEVLSENPKDYYTLLDRATQYCNLGMYDRALSDVDMALEYTPESDIDYRIAEYSLKADILSSQKEYSKAISAVISALKLDQQSLPNIYKLGTLYILNNNPEEALKAFRQLQRLSSRSQEAFYGMAKAYVMMGQNADAEDMLKEMENLGKGQYLTYCRLGDLYSDMGRTPAATSNYVIAYVNSNGNNRPLESLKTLARKDKDGVMRGLDALISAQSENINLLYLKIVIASDLQDHDMIEETCKTLIDKTEVDSASIYDLLALSQKALNKNEDALMNIKFAENFDKGNAVILAHKADILLATDPVQSLAAAEGALTIDPQLEIAMTTGAKAAILTGDANKAAIFLNNVIISNPGNIEALLLRGYMNEKLLKDEKAAKADYTRAGNVIASNASVMALAALGKAKAGKMLDAEGMIGDAISMAENDGNALYNIAVYYSQTGNLDKAREFIQKAKASGYNNLYNLNSNKEPLLNISPIF